MKKLAIALALLAAPVCADIGFELPPGTRSAAYNLVTPGETMDLSAHPFEPGLSVAQFYDRYSRRYGHAVQHPGEVFQLPDAHGHGHTSENYAFLETICRLNPAFFAEHGYGSIAPGTNCGDISEEEATDVQYAMVVQDVIFNESNRLNAAGGGGTNPPPPPPPTDAVCGNRHVEPGETCVSCPVDVCPQTIPPPVPVTPDHCNQAGAACRLPCAACPPPPQCPAPLPQPALEPIPLWVVAQCHAEEPVKPPAGSGAGKIAAWKKAVAAWVAKCDGLLHALGYVPALQSTAELRLVVSADRRAP